MHTCHSTSVHPSKRSFIPRPSLVLVQERKAICQALSREVGRMHRKAACCVDARTARQRHSWDEAFAQVLPLLSVMTTQ